jgi:predicted RNase H-like nuclease (RuvC/YqgF family)
MLEKNYHNLKKSVDFLTEEMKLLTKKLEFMQDNNAKLSVEMQAISEAVRFIVSTADTVIEQRKKMIGDSHPSIQ